MGTRKFSGHSSPHGAGTPNSRPRGDGHETCSDTAPMRPSSFAILRAAIVGLALGTAAPARAEAPPVKVMTLTEALAYARAHQPAIRAAMARVAAQEEDARIPRAEWLPSVGATVQGFAATANNSTGTYVGAPFVDVPRIGGTKLAIPGSARPYASTFVGAGLNQEVFDFGRIAARAAAADALVDVDPAARIRGAPRHRLLRRGGVLRGVRGQVDPPRRRGGRGARAGAPRSGQGRRRRGPALAGRADARRGRSGALRRGRRARGEPASPSPRASSRRPWACPSPRSTSSAAPPSTREMPSLADAVRDAAGRDPYILEAEARVRAEEKNTRAIGAELRPDLSLTSTISAARGRRSVDDGGRQPRRGAPQRPQLGRRPGAALADLRRPHRRARARLAGAGAGAARGARRGPLHALDGGAAGVPRGGRGQVRAARARARRGGGARQLRPGRRALPVGPRQRRRARRRRGPAHAGGDRPRHRPLRRWRAPASPSAAAIAEEP